MPETRFQVRWPDESLDSCYSPSLVVKKYLAPGESYSVVDFVSRCREALTIASDRVKQHFGYPCSLAAAQLKEIEETAARFEKDSQARVSVLGFEDL